MIFFDFEIFQQKFFSKISSIFKIFEVYGGTLNWVQICAFILDLDKTNNTLTFQAGIPVRFQNT